MGLTGIKQTSTFLCFFVLPAAAWAAPKLRLTATTVGPLSIASNSNGTLQTVEAYNAGDGALALTATANVTWLTASTGSLSACASRPGQCIPVRIEPKTSSLAKGTYTAVVTVADPAAQDAPQTITVTVKVGGGVPDRVESYVAPGNVGEVPFTANNALTEPIRAQSDGWLSVASEAGGTYRTVWNYRYRLDARGKGEGAYNGTATISGSKVAEENKTTQVVMRVTNSPILRLDKDAVSIRATQGAWPIDAFVSWSNTGGGTIKFSSFSIAPAGGDWLKVSAVEGTPYLMFTATPGALSPGVYTAQVTINSNSVNSGVVLPVQLELLAQSAPRAAFGRIQNVGSYDPADPLAPGTWVELYGEQFFYKEPVTAAAPFPDSLAGVRVLVNGRAAPLWYVRYNQINFQIPYETAPGDGSVTVERDGQKGNSISIAAVSSAPRIRRLGIADYGIIVNNTDGSFPMPPTPGLNARPVRRGEALVIYMVGFGQTNPPVASGAPAPAQEPLARVSGDPVRVTFGSGLFGGITVDSLFAGLTPNYSGLYQVNVIVPANAPVGDEVPLIVQQGAQVSNSVRVAIQ